MTTYLDAYSEVTSVESEQQSPTRRTTRVVAIVTAVAAYAGVALQLGLAAAHNANGYGPVLEALHSQSYFTVTSNLLVAIMATLVALRPERTGRWFDAIRLAALVMISVTGIVYWTMLAGPDLPTGLDGLANTLTHTVVPLLAVLGWLVAGPHGRFTWRSLPLMLVIPMAWLLHSLIRGLTTGFYHYWFMDASQYGYGQVALNLLGVLIGAMALAAAFVAIDRALGRRNRPEPTTA